MSATKTVIVSGIPIDDIGFGATVDSIILWAAEGSGGYVCTPNVDYIVRSVRNERFRRAMLRARLRVPDGMGIIYGSRLAGTPLQESVTGRLLPLAVSRIAATQTIPVGLFGGPPGVAERAAAALASSTGVEVRCALGPSMGFRLGSAEDTRLAQQIRVAGPRILFVALGAPKQEMWMDRHKDELGGCVQVGVGQAFDVLAGRRPEAPEWATRIGAEWAFRLVRDPKRLAPRYLRDDPRFFWWMLKQRLSRTGWWSP